MGWMKSSSFILQYIHDSAKTGEVWKAHRPVVITVVKVIHITSWNLYSVLRAKHELIVSECDFVQSAKSSSIALKLQNLLPSSILFFISSTKM
jgi:hypothetical protein